MFDDFDAMLQCPWCNAEQAWEECLLGELGGAVHFRCRGCHGQWIQEDED